MNEILETFYRHNRWANLLLLDLCASVGAETLDANTPSGHGSVRDTLLHLFAAEQRYVAALTNQPPQQPIREGSGPADLATLRLVAEANSEALIAKAATAKGDEVLRGERGGQAYALPVAIPLLQAINHATEHRAHVLVALGQQGITTPEPDAWAFNEAG